MGVIDQAATAGHGPLVRELLDLVARRVPGPRGGSLGAFARAYVRRLPAELAGTLSAEELFGQIVGLYELAERRGAAEVAVRALNPTPAADGYATAGSVIETNCEDSPFLVDTVLEELAGRDLRVRFVVHPVIGTERDEDGTLLRVAGVRDAPTRESVMHFETETAVPDHRLAAVAAGVRRCLGDVRLAVRDFAAMKDCVRRLVEVVRSGAGHYAGDEVEDAVAFLEWLANGHFVFLGYREYDIVDHDGEPARAVRPGSGLGILSREDASQYARPVPLAAIDPALRARLEQGDLLTVSKTNRLSTVHRRVPMDYVAVRRVDADGRTVGELLLLGLFTSQAYMEQAGRIPLLRRKLRQILDVEDLIEGSHDYKTAVGIFESFPKDELFAADVAELRRNIVGLLELQESRRVRLFYRRDLHGRSVSLVVALPRDRFSAALRHRLQELFRERFNGTNVDYHLSLGDTDPAQLHFAVHVPEGEIPDVSFVELEQEVVALTRTWDDRLRERLIARHGERRGRELAERYAARLPDYYKSSTDPYLSVLDIDQFERLEAGAPFAVALQNERGDEGSLTRVGLYKAGGKVPLSDFLPILEHLGLRVIEEVPTRLRGGDEATYLHDFGVLDGSGRLLDLAECGTRVADLISAVWTGEAESDSLNRLVVSAGLTWRQVAVLRAYRRYQARVGIEFTEAYQADAFAANPALAAGLVRLFECRFDPGGPTSVDAEAELRAELETGLDAVSSLDEDRILRGQLALVEATVRTNVFRPGRRGLSFKLLSAAVPGMPKPFPLYDVFVYSPEMEGVHLRGGKVARGGIRWSDRREDFRTEVLGLMKAQMVKNAVIVPVGAKGGFVLKRAPEERDALRADVLEQYTTFIRGLLDLTDDLVDGRVVHPPDVRVLDDDDPYLVVAADKGTATFSDTANGVAREYGYWLDDAFASGGSAGYDHKGLGITARGAWESVRRHFRELGVDVMVEPFTVVGVGDMSGDVFGNGMLLSRRTRLLAAFDHRHIFLDPDPDPEVSFAERARLFALPRSSWEDYDRTAISAGGGVWPRTTKRIPLSPEARRALGVEIEAGTPAEILRAVLRAPVDLFWNGGIGTFVKARTESNVEVGDRTNDAIRIDGADLRARVVGEGGNLGLTQRGRIEYAEAGGRINIDAIDNSAGVDLSDHEVNLKILLGLAEARGDLTRKQRDELLASVADDVVAHVLYDNYLQAQILSQEVLVSSARLEAYEDLMARLEGEGLLERTIETLPSTEEMAERRRSGRGLPRPVLCVLLAYAKRSLKAAVLASDLPDERYLDGELRRYFPDRVVERFEPLLAEHPLRREMLATIVANDVVNSLGVTFVARLAAETGAEPADIARAFWTAREVTGAVVRWARVEALDGRIDPLLQNDLMTRVDGLVESVARWYLTRSTSRDLAVAIDTSRAAMEELSAVIHETGSPEWQAAREETVRRLVEAGVPHEQAAAHAFAPELEHGPDIIAVASTTGRSIADVAHAFFLLGERLHLDWLEERVAELPAATRWQRWSLQAIADDLMLVRREVAGRVLAEAGDLRVEDALDVYLAGRTEAYERLSRLMDTLALEGVHDQAVLTVALRQVRNVVG